jgi:hypothetical protein
MSQERLRIRRKSWRLTGTFGLLKTTAIRRLPEYGVLRYSSSIRRISRRSSTDAVAGER